MKLSFYAATAVIALSGLSNALNLGGYGQPALSTAYAQIDALPVFFDELAQAGEKQLFPQALLDQYWALFDSTIKNGKRDGQMDVAELNKAMTQLGQPEEARTPEKLQAMIDKYDLNGDGTLSYDEFLVMMNWGPLPDPTPAPKPAAPAAPATDPKAPAGDAGKKATDCQKLSDAAATCKKNKEQKEAEDEAKKEEEKTKDEDKAKKEADKTK